MADGVCTFHTSRLVADRVILDFRSIVLGLWDTSTQNRDGRVDKEKVGYLMQRLESLKDQTYFSSRESVKQHYDYEFDFLRAEGILTRLSSGDVLDDKIFMDFYKSVPKLIPRSLF